MSKFVPLFNYLLVKPVEIPETTESGLLLPEGVKDKPSQGWVIEAGNGLYNDAGELLPVTVKAGQVVLFPKYVGTEIKLGKDKYLIMRETDLFGVVLE